MAKKKVGKSRRQTYRTGNVFVLRGTAAYRDWINDLATRVGMPATVLVDQLLRREARRVGFRPGPQRLEVPDEGDLDP